MITLNSSTQKPLDCKANSSCTEENVVIQMATLRESP